MISARNQANTPTMLLPSQVFSPEIWGDAIMNTFHTIGKRFTFGGDTGKDQRVYYFNTKELVDNKFGTPNPIPFRVVDRTSVWTLMFLSAAAVFIPTALQTRFSSIPTSAETLNSSTTENRSRDS